MPIVLLAILLVAPTPVLPATDEYFTAAVFEFVQLYDYCPETQEQADEIVRRNLNSYKAAAELAAAQGADLIAFPEYGIFPECSREITKMFLEIVPDPSAVREAPCDFPEKYQNMPQLYTLSCMAKNHSMYVQANTGDLMMCEETKITQCPKDGRLQLNTNVVFDREGAVVTRYHKEHLWGEEGMDMAVEKQNPIFKTDFGTFATFVCFDVVLARIIEVIEEPEVDGVVFSTMWENSAPLFTSVQYFQSWAMGNNASLIAADIQLPGQLAVGSGIFHAKEGALVYTYDPDGISKLLVARVPRRGHELKEPKASITAITSNGTYKWSHDGDDVPYETVHSTHYHLKDDLHHNRYHETDLVNYTLVQLTSPRDRLTTCNNGMCCTLDYSIENLNETFYFAVYNGTQGSFPPLFWCEEDCMLVRCDPRNDKPCSNFPLLTKNVFHHLSLRANYSTPFVYPSVVSNRMRLVPRRQWEWGVNRKHDHYESFLDFHSEKGQDILAVGLKGRCYKRDPPASFF
ncbi:pantetheinase [Caerostris extrusa]|uniref:Pantetheinase n=1 Tax=Caerostris extrusa TaxID=172846 RepID=A0AAV4UP58_CAEEX|nr:pantetheinase [Caerostris extrusa]